MEVDRHEPELIGRIDGKWIVPCVTPIITSSIAKGVNDAILKSKGYDPNKTEIINCRMGKDGKIHCEVIH